MGKVQIEFLLPPLVLLLVRASLICGLIIILPRETFNDISLVKGIS